MIKENMKPVLSPSRRSVKWQVRGKHLPHAPHDSCIKLASVPETASLTNLPKSDTKREQRRKHLVSCVSIRILTLLVYILLGISMTATTVVLSPLFNANKRISEAVDKVWNTGAQEEKRQGAHLLTKQTETSKTEMRVETNRKINSQDIDSEAARLRDMVTPPDRPIYGNPMLNVHCQNALLQAHGHKAQELIDQYKKRYEDQKEPKTKTEKQSASPFADGRHLALSSDEVATSPIKQKTSIHLPPNNLPPSFWSREALTAMLAEPGHNNLTIHSFLRSNWEPARNKTIRIEFFKDGSSVSTNKTDIMAHFSRGAYIHMPKTGSSSMAALFKRATEAALSDIDGNLHKGNRQAKGKNDDALYFMVNANVRQVTQQRRSAMLKNSLQTNDDSFYFPDYPREEYTFQDGDCTFGFARDPLHRLISAYYTINAMVRGQPMVKKVMPALLQQYEFLSIEEEPLRFRTFVKEMKKFSNEFVVHHPMQHVYTMAGNLSPFFGMDVHFFGRVEHFDEHLETLSRWERCRDFVGQLLGQEDENNSHNDKATADSESSENTDEQLRSSTNTTSQGNPGIPHALKMDFAIKAVAKHYNESMKANVDVAKSGRYSLPQYAEIKRDQELFNDIIEHYWQDYVCFGYDLDYPDLGRTYTGDFVKPY